MLQHPPVDRTSLHILDVACISGKSWGLGTLHKPLSIHVCIQHCRNVTKKKKPPRYRVMLHNDSFNRREYVVKVLLKVVDVITMADAVNIMQASAS